MTRLTDETLMLFADGLLDGAEGERVGRLAAESPDLSARLNIFHVTGQGLARLFDEHANAPVPARLQAFLAGQHAGPSSVAASDRWRRAMAALSAARMRIPRRTVAWNGPAALAASLALIAGIGLGWLLRGEPGSGGTDLRDFVQVENNRLLARGALEKGLETWASGGDVTVASGGSEQVRIRVKMTFRDEARDYCRQYEITTALQERHSGVACRIGGQWTVAMQALLPPSRPSHDRTVLAGSGSNAAMDAAVGAMINGDPLGRGEETAIIRDGWQK
jgi:hypothetical protein